MDESGTDEKSTTAVLGGIVLDRNDFGWLDLSWQQMLKDHQVPEVHMKEFGQHGKLGHLRRNARFDLLSDAVKLINKHKTFTLAARVSATEYRKHFAALITKNEQMGVYGICFLVAMIVVAKQAIHDGFKDKIPFLLDTGNVHSDHVVLAHRYATVHAPEDYSNIGGLAFESDADKRVLQACDVIAWSVRRKHISGAFKNGFEPLVGIFESNHAEQPIQEQWLAEIAADIKAHRRKRKQP